MTGNSAWPQKLSDSNESCETVLKIIFFDRIIWVNRSGTQNYFSIESSESIEAVLKIIFFRFQSIESNEAALKIIFDFFMEVENRLNISYIGSWISVKIRLKFEIQKNFNYQDEISYVKTSSYTETKSLVLRMKWRMHNCKKKIISPHQELTTWMEQFLRKLIYWSSHNCIEWMNEWMLRV